MCREGRPVNWKASAETTRSRLSAREGEESLRRRHVSAPRLRRGDPSGSGGRSGRSRGSRSASSGKRAADFEREREVPLHGRQPFGQVVGGAAQQKIAPAPRCNARRRYASRSARSKISVGPAMIAELWLRRRLSQSRRAGASGPAPDASVTAGACHSPEIPVYPRIDGRCRHARTGSALAGSPAPRRRHIPASFARPRPAAALPRLRPPGGKRGDLCVRPAGRRCGFIERPYCEQLGIPFAYDLGPGALSAEAIADPPPFERCRAVCRLRRGRAQAGAWPQVSRPSGTGRLDGRLDGARRRGAPRRGRHDRAGAAPSPAALAAALQPVGSACRHDRRRLPASRSTASSLTRIRPTRQQVGLSAAERDENVRGAFRDRAASSVRRSPDGGSSWSTTSTPPARRSRRRRGRSSAPAPPPSTCSSLRGLCAAPI